MRAKVLSISRVRDLSMISPRLWNKHVITHTQAAKGIVSIAYTAYATMSVSVCLSVTEVHWRIIQVSNSDPNLPRIAVAVHAGAREGIIAGKSGEIISRYASHC